jgi:EAL domain-containing protein (putative c-di-GMP-specific phosphodiesterase class I)/GGDEF domain-containing protein
MRVALTRVEVLALFPILVLLAQEFGGPQAVLGAAMILPTLMVLLNLGAGAELAAGAARHDWREEDGRGTMLVMLDRVATMPGSHGACFVLELDGWDVFLRQWGPETGADVLERVRDRLRAALRDADHLSYLGGGRFGAIGHGPSSARRGVRNAMADRLQACVSEPLRLDETSIRLTASLGHAPLQRDGMDPAGHTLGAAELALAAAQAAGPGSMRAHWEGMAPPGARGRSGVGIAEADLAAEVPEGLQTGAIQPWFQPIADTRSGVVTGFEVLARWQHPVLGTLAPARLAESLARAGQMDTVAARLRERAVDALGEWDRTGQAGADPLTLTIRADADMLRTPALAEQVVWTLDAADIAPDRLSFAIPEPLSGAPGTDAIADTLIALRARGVRLELDDFGIVQTSLLSIRRFGIGRIRIDRSLVAGIDQDPDQRAMVGGILSLAREMGLGTLAQGVETAGERRTLVEMGCDLLQGAAVAGPMGFVEAQDWLMAQRPATGRAAPDLPEERPGA